MSKEAAIAAGIALSMLLATSAVAFANGQEALAPINPFTALTPNIGLADAVASAESGINAKVLEIHFTKTGGQLAYPGYEAILLSGDKLAKVNVDAITGIASMPRDLSASSATGLRGELMTADALKNPPCSLRQAIDTAQQHVAGRAIDAWLTKRDGKPAYAIGIVEAKQVRTVVVDPMTGKIIGELRTKGASALGAQVPATLGDREGTALDPLEAKGYRDFSFGQRTGMNLAVTAMPGSKQVTLAVDPETGRIAMRAWEAPGGSAAGPAGGLAAGSMS